MNQPKKRLGDRHDGYRIRNSSAIYQLIPFVMRSRLDSQVLFDDVIDLEELEKFVRKMRSEQLPQLAMIHVIMAALVRTFSQRPRVNRFIVGKKTYARRSIRFAMGVKQAWNENANTADIIVDFGHTDTLFDVVRKVDEAILEVRESEANNANTTDRFARAVSYVPGFVKALIVGAMRNLDKIGLMPKAVYKLSPFHTSAFITDVGSLGVNAVYHHLYEFGTTSLFLSVGKKGNYPEALPSGEIRSRRKLHLRYVIDERVNDGFYFSASLKLMNRLLKSPEVLLTPPDKVVYDER